MKRSTIVAAAAIIAISLLATLLLISSPPAVSQERDLILSQSEHFKVVLEPQEQQLHDAMIRSGAATPLLMAQYANAIVDTMELAAKVVLDDWGFAVPGHFRIWKKKPSTEEKVEISLKVLSGERASTHHPGALLNPTRIVTGDTIRFEFPIEPPQPPGSRFTSPFDDMDRVMATSAHELFHFIQYGYDDAGSPTKGLREMTSVWSEDKILPFVKSDPAKGGISFWLPAWNDLWKKSLDDLDESHDYASSLFLQFLTDQFASAADPDGHVLVRTIWEEVKRNPEGGTFRAISKTLGRTDFALLDAVTRFYALLAIRDGAPIPGDCRLKDAKYTERLAGLTNPDRRSGDFLSGPVPPPWFGIKTKDSSAGALDAKNINLGNLRLTGRYIRIAAPPQMPNDAMLCLMTHTVGGPSVTQVKFLARYADNTWEELLPESPPGYNEVSLAQINGFGAVRAQGCGPVVEEVIVVIGYGMESGDKTVVMGYACLAQAHVKAIRVRKAGETSPVFTSAAAGPGKVKDSPGRLERTGDGQTATLEVEFSRPVVRVKALADGKAVTMTPAGGEKRIYSGTFPLDSFKPRFRAGTAIQLQIEAASEQFPDHQALDADGGTPVKFTCDAAADLPKLTGYEGESGRGTTLGGPCTLFSIPVKKMKEEPKPVGEHLLLLSEGSMVIGDPSVGRTRTVDLGKSILMTPQSHPREFSLSLALSEDGSTVTVGLPCLLFSIGPSGLFGSEENPRLAIVLSPEEKHLVSNSITRGKLNEETKRLTGTVTLTECSENVLAGTVEALFETDTFDLVEEKGSERRVQLTKGSAALSGSFRFDARHFKYLPLQAMKTIIPRAQELSENMMPEVSSLDEVSGAFERVAQRAGKLTSSPLPNDKEIQEAAGKIKPGRMAELRSRIEEARRKNDTGRISALLDEVRSMKAAVDDLEKKLARYRRDAEMRAMQGEMMEAMKTGNRKKIEDAQKRMKALLAGAQSADAADVKAERQKIVQLLKSRAVPFTIRP